MSKYLHIFRYGFFAFVIVYLIVSINYFTQINVGAGDEALFIYDLNYISKYGWQAAIEKGISIPYMLISYLFSLFFEEYIALRVVNIFLFIGLIFYFFKIKKLRNLDFYALLLFYFATAGYFFKGINDPLFVIALVIFFTETYFILKTKEKQNIAVLFTALIFVVFTRALFVVFLPAILFSIYLIRKQIKLSFKKMIPAIFFLMLFSIINIPSIAKNNTLSYDAKDPPPNAISNWAQRQYLAQLQVNNGERDNFTHPSWKETDQYLIVNGEDSLPKGILSGLTFNIDLTIKEFFKDLGYIIVYSSRQLGLILPILFYFGFLLFMKQKKITSTSYACSIITIMTTIFALIIISYIELRWFGSFFLLAILAFSELIQKKQLHNFITVAHYLIMIAICCYGIVQKVI
ncbi:hypothetical protein [Patiriisocius hiemis]|uniref:Glycosyltransferase RgtA/B/C/D-like domain-containing protein n=1 Tax=Patiriisocius hiemis TaxID=3075604 RepID=A0ABU2YCY5_9FLAO|nr:hypothetical protein [Constantimarinum sp. W242]MDT0556051.1 hypothetical protein [Constantimarinum sp. W242]